MGNAKHPSSRTLLEKELSRRARTVLSRFDNDITGEVQLDNLLIICTQGDLLIERAADFRMIYMETPNQTVVRTSLEHELSWALDQINRFMVLDDIANA